MVERELRVRYLPGRNTPETSERQKRPTIEAKETYYRGKRDLL